MHKIFKSHVFSRQGRTVRYSPGSVPTSGSVTESSRSRLQIYCKWLRCLFQQRISHCLVSLASQPSKRKDHTQWIVLTSGTSTLTKSQVVGQIWMTPIFSDKLLLLLSKWCKTKEKDIPRIISSKNPFILIILCVFFKGNPNSTFRHAVLKF